MAHRVPRRRALMVCDQLVFSSHKTASRTIVKSLRANGFRARSGHTLRNFGLSGGSFAPFLRDYRHRRDEKIKLISVFRDPMDRLVSSFFQTMSAQILARVFLPKFWRMSDDTLSAMFSKYVTVFDGYGESIDIILRETGVHHQDLSFDTTTMSGKFEAHDDYDLYLYRFDVLVKDWNILFGPLGIDKPEMISRNISEEKEYYDAYIRFRESYKLKPDVIQKIFKRREPLLDLFFPGQRQAMLEQALSRHGA